MPNAIGGKTYDFKTRRIAKGLSGDERDQYVYRGMSFNGKIASARDIGNYAAGYVAGVHGISWENTRTAFDTLQTKQQNADWNIFDWKWNIEGQPSQRAQRVGYNIGIGIFKQRQFERE